MADLFDIVIAKKLSGGSGGGGGSSVFSTAEVTFTAPGTGVFITPIVVDDTSGLTFWKIEDQSEAETLNVVLYNGKQEFWADFNYGATSVTVTGDITYDSETFVITVSGDGTITLGTS